METIVREDYQDGRLIVHPLYKYEVEDIVTDDRGETRVVGHHKKIGLISDSLKKRLLDNGISNKELEEFMPVSYTHLDVYKRQLLYLVQSKLCIAAAPVWSGCFQFQ